MRSRDRNTARIFWNQESIDKQSQSWLNTVVVTAGPKPASLIFLLTTIAHDKGKPAARQGRKAVSLGSSKIVWLPKAIGEKPELQLRESDAFS